MTSAGAAAERRIGVRDRLGIISRPWVWVAALTLLAFLLRRFHLGEQSLWFDEADIVQRAQQPVSILAQNFVQAGENGPFYTLLLHFWLAVVGASPALTRALHALFGANYEATVRGLSALSGTAAIPVIYLLGKRLGGVMLGVVAAILLAFNPFHIWYSQDAKMYALLVLATLVSTLLYLYALERNTVPLWAAYVLSTWVMLTVHSLAGLVLLAQIAATPLLARRARVTNTTSEDRDFASAPVSAARPRWLYWGIAMALIFAPLLPIMWLRIAAAASGTLDVGGWYAPTGLADLVLTIFVKFAVNQAPAPWEAVGGLVMGALVLVGLVVIARRVGTKAQAAAPEGEIALVPILWLLPILAFWVITLAVPLFQPRYLIMSLAPYLIMAGLGLLALKRFHIVLLAAALAALALPTVAALWNVNYSTEAQKEDWRGAMVYVQDHLRQFDAIVVFPGYLRSAVDTYYKPGGPGNVPDVPVLTVNSLLTANFGQRELEAELRNTAKCHARVWLVTSPGREKQEDPQNRVRQWYQYNYHTFDTQVFNGVTVYGVSFNGVPSFGTPDCGWFPPPTYNDTYTFTNGLQLWGYDYPLRGNSSTQPDASYFPMTLYWHNPSELSTDYIVRIQVKDKSGKVAADSALGTLNGYWPTSEWPANSYPLDYRDIRLPGGMTPGDYSVTLQLYPKGYPDQPLKLTDGSTQVTLKAPLHVVAWKP